MRFTGSVIIVEIVLAVLIKAFWNFFAVMGMILIPICIYFAFIIWKEEMKNDIQKK